MAIKENLQSPGFISPANWKIRSKIMGAILLIVILSVLSSIVFNYYRSSKNAVEAAAAELTIYGKESLRRFNEVILGSVKALETLALSPSLVEAVMQANQTYKGRSPQEIDAEIQKLDQAWKDEDPSVEGVVNNILENPLSDHLRQFVAAFPEEVEVFVTDIQGVNIGMTERTGDYLQADESWWENAYAGGAGDVFVSEVEYDDSAKVYAMDVGVPVRDPDSDQVVGILRGTINVTVVFEALSKITLGETGRAALIDRQGNLLYAPNADLLMKPAPEEYMALIASGTDGYTTQLRDLDGNRSIQAYLFMEGDLADSLGWIIWLDQDLAEVNAPVRASLLVSLLVGLVIALVLSLIGIFVANSIARPVEFVAQSLRRLSTGNVNPSESDRQIRDELQKRGDELGTAAKALAKLENYFINVAADARRIAEGNLSLVTRSYGAQDVLGNAFIRMADNLRQQVSRVADNSSQLSHAASQMAHASNQAGQATSQIASTLQQVARGTTQQTLAS